VLKTPQDCKVPARKCVTVHNTGAGKLGRGKLGLGEVGLGKLGFKSAAKAVNSVGTLSDQKTFAA